MGISKTRVVLERAVGQRVAVVAGLVQVGGRERVAVDDQRAARRQVADVRLERGRVHGHQHVGLVAGRVDLVAREADLEAADARQRAGRGADLGGEVGQRADVVAEDGRRAGELRAGELHAVAGVAGEADGHPLELLDVILAVGVSVVTRPPAPPCVWCGRGGRLRISSGKASATYSSMSCWRRMPSMPPLRRPAARSGSDRCPWLERVANGLIEVSVSGSRRHERVDRVAPRRRGRGS